METRGASGPGGVGAEVRGTPLPWAAGSWGGCVLGTLMGRVGWAEVMKNSERQDKEVGTRELLNFLQTSVRLRISTMSKHRMCNHKKRFLQKRRQTWA